MSTESYIIFIEPAVLPWWVTALVIGVPIVWLCILVWSSLKLATLSTSRKVGPVFSVFNVVVSFAIGWSAYQVQVATPANMLLENQQQALSEQLDWTAISIVNNAPEWGCAQVMALNENGYPVIMVMSEMANDVYILTPYTPELQLASKG